jgi:hypothetical protein
MFSSGVALILYIQCSFYNPLVMFVVNNPLEHDILSHNPPEGIADIQR